MTNSLGIDVSADPIERMRADIAIVTFFEDERPLTGAAGRADWRLCGKLSELIVEGQLSGAAGEAVLVTPRGALRSPILLALGLGPRRAFGADALAATAREVASRSLALGASNLALPLPGSGSTGTPLRTRAEAVVRGVTAAVRERRADLHLQLVAETREVVPLIAALQAVGQPRSPSDVVLHVFTGSRPDTQASGRQPGGAGARERASSPRPTSPRVVK